MAGSVYQQQADVLDKIIAVPQRGDRDAAALGQGEDVAAAGLQRGPPSFPGGCTCRLRTLAPAAGAAAENQRLLEAAQKGLPLQLQQIFLKSLQRRLSGDQQGPRVAASSSSKPAGPGSGGGSSSGGRIRRSRSAFGPNPGLGADTGRVELDSGKETVGEGVTFQVKRDEAAR